MTDEKPLWTPPPQRVENSNLNAFIKHVGEVHGVQCRDYHELYEWSVREPAAFWQLLLRESALVAEGSDQRVIVDAGKMPGAQWFPDLQLNYAENLLRRRDDSQAMVFRGEDGHARAVTYADMYRQVARIAQALIAADVQPGDRVVGYMPNIPETVMAMLAATSIGAVWSSSSPDFGARGVLDRFGQIEPVVLFTCDAYRYNGKVHRCLDTVVEIAAQLPTLRHIVVHSFVDDDVELPASLPAAVKLERFADNNATDVPFKRLPFSHPLYIMFSSGTTGVPKCIVHSAGGTLLQHVKEHRLHIDLKPNDRMFYFTTCGWMMWNWLVTALASEVTLMLYDGSPFFPDGNVLFDYADQERVNVFGTSAKFLDAAAKAGIEPLKTHSMATVQSVLSTGSTLSPEGFDYVYRSIKQDVWLASMSGGTDMMGCFVSGTPTLPVYRGQLQCRALALAVEVFDDTGQAVTGQKGELVCTAPFPSMPLGFWNDEDGAKYHSAYFDRFDNVWCHGDFIELTAQQGMVIYGRSDAVLNPGGVRIGTAEIYRQVEQLDEVVEGLVIGQQWQDDVRVVLFVRLRDELILDDSLTARIKKQIRDNTTPRHVPAVVIQVADIPRTKSGKIVELAVRNIVHGEPVRNREALANPQALELFANLPQLG